MQISKAGDIRLAVAGISCDPPPLVGLCKRRVCVGIVTLASFSIQTSGSGVLNKRTNNGVSARGQNTLSAPGFKLSLLLLIIRRYTLEVKIF
jgi:hypothetical protein